jgi:hypothetical protein
MEESAINTRSRGIRTPGVDRDRGSWSFTLGRCQAEEKKKTQLGTSAACGGRLRRGIRWMKIKGRKERLETVHRNG